MWRSTKFLFSLLAILFFFFQWTGEGYAQCGFHMTEEEKISYPDTLRQLRERTTSRQRLSSEPMMYVPVKLHVMTQSNGEGGVNMGRFIESFALMNHHFAQINIQFYICGQVNYIASDRSFHYSSNVANTDLPIGHEEPNAINVIYYKSVELNGSLVGGFAYLPYGPLRVYMSQNSDEYTLIHEMGHFYGLLHTFNNSTSQNSALRELVTRGAGANCEDAGDYLCDTPADPYTSGYPLYFPGCIYTEELFDANGNRYQPMLNNIMSYYGGCKPEEFTSDQNELMRSYKNLPVRSRWTTTCESLLPPVDLVAVADPVYGVRLTWRDNQDDVLAYVVEISEGSDQNFYFSSIVSASSKEAIVNDLKSNTIYYFRVKPLNSPDGYSAAASFTTSQSFCFPVNNKQCIRENYIFNGEYPYIGIKSVGVDGGTKFEHLSGCADYAYDFYTADTISLYKGMPHQLQVEQMVKSRTHPVFKVLLWIDLNEDGVFDEENERWGVDYSSAMRTYVTRLIINDSVKSGTKRARIRMVDSGDAAITACGNTPYGETQDYVVNVSDLPSAYPLQLTIDDDDVNIRWTNSGLPQGTLVVLYMDNGREIKVLDTLSVDQLAYQLQVFGNGEYAYFMRSPDNQTLLSNIARAQIDSYTYCVPSFDSNCGGQYEVERITIEGETTFRQEETCSQSGYQLYRGSVTSMFKGGLYSVSIKQKSANGWYYVGTAKAWIDFNQDGDFDENEEFLLISSGSTHTGSVSIPNTALSGVTGLRVRISSDSKMTPCEVIVLSDTKDYEVEIKRPANSLPVELTAVHQTSYLNRLDWSYDDIPGEMLVNIYSGKSAQDLLQIGMSRLDQLTFSDLVGSNGTYYYAIKDANSGELLSNTALVEVNDAGIVFQLEGTYADNVSRLQWNVQPYTDGIKALMYRSYDGNADNIRRLDTILLTNGYYEDIRLMTGDGDILLNYQIRSLRGELLSNTLTIDNYGGYCIPEFKNSNCIDPLSYVWQTKEGESKQILYRDISNCTDNNKFKLPNLHNPVDTLYHDASYDLFVSLKYPCETGSSGSQRNILVYLDLNRDSEFSEDEIVVERMADDFVCSGTFRFQLPDTMGTGLSRLRYLISEPGYAVANSCGVFEQASGFDLYVYLKGRGGVTSSIASLSSDFSVSIYPNPSNDGSFTIDSKEEVTHVRILGITGETFFEGDKKLIPRLASGFYMVQISTRQGGYSNMKLLVR